MSNLVGKDQLLITNFPFEPVSYAQCTPQSVNDFLKNVPLERICLLDSEATETLSPADSQNFDYFLFGGILGNGKLRCSKVFSLSIPLVDEFDFDRTSVLRVRGFPTRNLGNMQMTTDTAVRVSKMILIDGATFPEIPFVDRPEFEVQGQQERLVMNFRYVADEQGEPLICPEVLALLKEDFEFNLEDLE